MNRHATTSVLITLAAMLFAAGFSTPEAGKRKKIKDEETGTVPVMEWLVLGPLAAPFPVFHGDKPGSFGAKEMLEADRFPAGPLQPVAGEGGWQVLQAGKDGLVGLNGPEGWDGPAEAWLAAWITTDRWRTLQVQARCSHPLKLYLDGEAVADGGYAAPNNDNGDGDGLATVEGKLKMTPGKHLLAVRTLMDPERESSWQAGVELLDADGTGLSLDRTRNMSIADILDAPVPRSARVSPDGALVAYTVRQGTYGADSSESWIEIRSLPGGDLVRKLRGGESKSRLNWAPNGRRLSYVSRNPTTTPTACGSRISTVVRSRRFWNGSRISAVTPGRPPAR